MKLPAPLTYAILVLVSLVWAGNFVASVVIPGHQSDSAINFVFMTIVGGALALKRNDDADTGPGVLSRVLAALRPPAPPPPAPPEESP